MVPRFVASVFVHCAVLNAVAANAALSVPRMSVFVVVVSTSVHRGIVAPAANLADVKLASVRTTVAAPASVPVFVTVGITALVCVTPARVTRPDERLTCPVPVPLDRRTLAPMSRAVCD